ncbi:MAG: choice-of-anchor L domain-containing protein, partial [Burkholderiales bacterium]|nr:choice-of-anchor L domain-containing protein [Burkholderiales bacterium]
LLANELQGGSGNDTLVGVFGNDTLRGDRGNDRLEGGVGIDAAEFAGLRADYTVALLPGDAGVTVTDRVSGRDGIDTLIGVERLIFADQTVTPVNVAPVVALPLPDLSVNIGLALDFLVPAGTFTDENGDVLSLSASQADGSPLPAWLTFNAGSGRFSGTPPLASVGSLALRVSASDGEFGTSDTFTLTVADAAASLASGRVIDGYVSGAAIYIDRNANNRPDPDEATGLLTDAQGRFAGAVFASGSLMAVGGTSTDTGLPNRMTLSAPAGSAVISPLTTLVEALIDQQAFSAAGAQAALAAAFGLPTTLNLLQYDPLAQPPGNAGAVSVQQLIVQLAITATLADNTSGVMAGVARLVADAVAAGGAGGVVAIDLADSATLESALSATTASVGVQDAIARANAGVQAAGTLAQIADVQREASPDFREWVAATDTVGSLISALLAPGSGITVNAASLALQYGRHLDESTGTYQASVGFYNGGIAGLGIGAGLILSSGDASPPQRNTATEYSAILEPVDSRLALVDADLQAAALTGFAEAGEVADVTMLSFDFTLTDPASTSVRLELVFASDEYPEFSESSYVDIAGVFVNGVNYALFGGNANQPLSILDRNLAAGAFVANASGAIPIEYDGLSRKLTVIAPVHSGVNTIKIAVGDTGDSVLDSSLFVSSLRAGNYLSGALSRQLDGSAGADDVRGGDINEFIELGSGDDRGSGGGGDDLIDGGSGVDEARYASARADSTIERRSNGDIRIRGPEGTDDLHDVERAVFSDGAVGFDIAGTGGKAYRLYQAAFDRVPDEGGVGFWMYYIDRGFSLVDAAANFMTSTEF